MDASVSGLDDAASTLTGTVNTDSTDAKTVTFKASDLAGNEATRECTYAVIPGFYPPVAPAPAWNAAKAGSAVPLKFSLEGSEGLGMAPGYPASQAVTCDSRTPAGTLQPVGAAGDGGLNYDAAAGRYDVVWKTDKAWAGSCRVLVIRLTDGAEFHAYFQFK